MAKVKVKATIEDADHVRGDLVTNGGFILLVTSSNNICISGVVLESTIKGVAEFSHQSGLNKSLFRKFRGTISIIQD